MPQQAAADDAPDQCACPSPQRIAAQITGKPATDIQQSAGGEGRAIVAMLYKIID